MSAWVVAEAADAIRFHEMHPRGGHGGRCSEPVCSFFRGWWRTGAERSPEKHTKIAEELFFALVRDRKV